MNTYTNIETKSIDLAPGNAESAHATQTMAARETVEGVGLPFDMLMRGPRAVATFFKNSPLLVHHSSPVRIAILGAEKQDMACNGGLYQLLPELLGDHSLQLRVDLVGPDVLPDFANVDLTTIGLRPAVCHAKSAGEWWASVTKERRPDVIFVFHPGMEKWHEEWLRADELPIILRSGIPTVFYSYDLDESQRDAHILSLHGAHLDLQPTAIEDNLPVSKVGLADFQLSFDPVSVHLTARVRTCFAKIADLRWVNDKNDRFYEGMDVLCTCYALLALETCKGK